MADLAVAATAVLGEKVNDLDQRITLSCAVSVSLEPRVKTALDEITEGNNNITGRHPPLSTMM